MKNYTLINLIALVCTVSMGAQAMEKPGKAPLEPFAEMAPLWSASMSDEGDDLNSSESSTFGPLEEIDSPSGKKRSPLSIERSEPQKRPNLTLNFSLPLEKPHKPVARSNKITSFVLPSYSTHIEKSIPKSQTMPDLRDFDTKNPEYTPNSDEEGDDDYRVKKGLHKTKKPKKRNLKRERGSAAIDADETQNKKANPEALIKAERKIPADLTPQDIHELGIRLITEEPRNFSLARFCFRDAADMGYAPSNAAHIYAFGNMLLTGQGVLFKNEVLGLNLIQNAADAFNFPEAQFQMGVLYEAGYKDILAQDLAKAMEYYIFAADQDHAEALMRLARYWESEGDIELRQECLDTAKRVLESRSKTF